MTEYADGIDMGRATLIAAQNDAFRSTLQGGRLHITEGIHQLDEVDRARVISATRAFSDFTPDNDPYREHDYGSFEVPDVGHIHFKIDYYNKDLDGMSEDPLDASKTVRVMTIMFAQEA